MQFAMGATYLWSGRVSLYGGPFLHYISGDFDYELNKIAENLDLSTKNIIFPQNVTTIVSNALDVPNWHIKFF
jgi:hypothetical protein